MDIYDLSATKKKTHNNCFIMRFIFFTLAYLSQTSTVIRFICETNQLLPG